MGIARIRRGAMLSRGSDRVKAVRSSTHGDRRRSMSTDTPRLPAPAYPPWRFGGFDRTHQAASAGPWVGFQSSAAANEQAAIGQVRGPAQTGATLTASQLEPS